MEIAGTLTSLECFKHGACRDEGILGQANGSEHSRPLPYVEGRSISVGVYESIIGMITVLYPLKCLEKSVEISMIFDNVNPIIYGVNIL